MFALLVQRNFCLLWVAHTISILGDYVFFIAITFWIYEQTGSASATGAVLIASTVPGLLFAPLAGMFVDRCNRRNIMFVAESARTVLFVGLLGLIIIQPQALWPVYVVGFVQSALATFFWPARSALLPQLIEPSALFAANALYMVSDSAVRVVAPSLSAFMLLRFGSSGVIALDIATFVISAGSVCLLRIPFLPLLKSALPLKREDFSSTAIGLPEQGALWKVGLLRKRAWWTHPQIIAIYRTGVLFVLGSILAWTAGTLSILFPVFVRAWLSAGPVAYGWILTAQALGGGAISLLLGQTRRQQGHFRVVIFTSGYLAVGGFALMLLSRFHTLIPVLLLNLIFGAVTTAITVQLLTFLQQQTANRFLGRLLAAYTAAQTLAQVVGMGVASVTLWSVGVAWLLLLNGVLCLFGGVLVWILLTGGSASRSSSSRREQAPQR